MFLKSHRAVIAISLWVVMGVPAAAQTRIVCIGDSITQSSSTHRSYRYNLWTKLLDAGFTFEFVGSMSANFWGSPTWPGYMGETFDPDHEGHWGWRADEILASLPGWLLNYTPDVALVHLGTNDLIQGNNITGTVDEIAAIIDRLRLDNPDVLVLLAQVIPYAGYANSASVPGLNTQLATMASTKGSAQSPVVIVDQYSGFSAMDDTFDGVHPNASGEEKMASGWMDSLLLHLAATPLVIDSAALPDGVFGEGYHAELAATGGLVPYRWSLGAGSSLPPGVVLAEDGVLSGTPELAGDFTFEAKVTDASSAADQATISLRIATALEAWRQLHFGTELNAGDAADDFDFDHDGLVNLIEFAFGLNPRTPGGSALLPQVQINGGNLVYQFEQPAGVSGIRYDAEWNTGLSGEWTRIASSVAAPEHYFSVPMGTTPRLFVRLVVSVP